MYITKLDKGSGVVILNRPDYLDKMANIWKDSSEFKMIGPHSMCDYTNRAEVRTQRLFLSAYKNKLISNDINNRVSPVGSQRPRIYGLS